MPTFNFSLSAKTDKVTGKHEVLLRFAHGHTIDQRAKTNVFVLPEYWNKERQCNTIPRLRVMSNENKALLNDLNAQNAKLTEIKSFIQQAFIKAGAGKVELSKDWLSSIVARLTIPQVDTKSESFFDVFTKFIDTLDVSDSRQRHFRVVWRSLKRFALYKDVNISFDGFTTDLLREYTNFLSYEHTLVEPYHDGKGRAKAKFLDLDYQQAFMAVPESRFPQKRGENAIYNLVSKLRSFFLWAIKEHLTKNDPFIGYKMKEPKYGTPYYITIEERNHLYKFDFSDNPKLAIQRDVFVFQCLIGCRVSDLYQLTKSSIVNGCVEFIPKKTKEMRGERLRVPLNATAIEILNRYRDVPGDRLFPFIAMQRYNDAIKEMFRKAGLTRVVTILNPTTGEQEWRPICEVASSHLARRCFVGNLYKQVKDPNLIGKLTGHVEGSRAFTRYRDIDEEMSRELVNMLV